MLLVPGGPDASFVKSIAGVAASVPLVGLHVKNEEVPRLVRDAGSQAGIWALAFQDALTDNNVTVKPGPSSQKATRLSGHFFVCERPNVVQAGESLRPRGSSSVKRRNIKQA
jgi:hypothetical protein